MLGLTLAYTWINRFLKLAIIFRSYAKNSYSWGSDIDILLVAQKLPKRSLERPQILIDPNLPIQIEPFAYTPEEFNKMIRKNHPLVNEALKNGKTIYVTSKYKKLLTQITLKPKSNKWQITIIRTI